jgi:transcriptional pleiotropic regulator of transition state genes
MKSIGVVRKLDSLGRIVLPKELRDTMDIAEKDPLEIFVDGNSIYLKKYEPVCIFCGGTSDVSEYKCENICSECIKELNHL